MTDLTAFYQDLISSVESQLAPEMEKVAGPFMRPTGVMNRLFGSPESRKLVQNAAAKGNVATRQEHAKRLLAERRKDAIPLTQRQVEGLHPGMRERAVQSPIGSRRPGILQRKTQRARLRGDPEPMVHSGTPPVGEVPMQAPPGQLGARHYIGAGLGAAGLGAGSYMLGNTIADRNNSTRRNIAFGSGMAAGLAAPALLRGATGYVNQLQGNPYGY